MKRKISKLAAITMAVFLMVTSITPAFAAMEKVTLNMRELGTYFNVFHNVPSFGKYTGRTTVFMIGGEYAFCIESGNAIRNGAGDRWVPGSMPVFVADYNTNVLTEDNSLQSKIAYLGFLIHKENPAVWNDQITRDWYYAMTQMLIWQTLPATYTTANGITNGVYNSYFTNQSMLGEYESFKEHIQRKLDTWDTKPSFDAKTQTILAGDTLNLTDSNGVLEDYNTFKYSEKGVTVSHFKGSNQLSVCVAQNCSQDKVKISEEDFRSVGAEKYSDMARVNYTYQAARSQDLVMYGHTTPVGLSLSLDVDIITGRIAIEKTKAPDAASQESLPEEGSEFQVFQKSAGSYEKAAEKYRDLITTDSSGKAITKELSHGTYTVHQTKGAEGHSFIKDFDVTITSDVRDKIYTYKLNDETLQSRVQIVKKDAETGKTIPRAGTEYELTNLTTGEKVLGTSKEGCFVTDKNGIIQFTKPLYYGTYLLTEKTAPEGYVLSKPIEFAVDGTQALLTIEANDMAQKGIIKLYKTGEVFQSVEEEECVHAPIFEKIGMEGAVFEVKAAEDIVTFDGTMRAAKGETVDTITTDAIGEAQTKEIYLGKYEIREITAPFGHVLDKKVYEAELKYGGQEVIMTDTLIAIDNEIQKLKISFKKFIEEDELFNIFAEDVYQGVKFGLFAAEEIKAKDGSLIPRDGLVAVAGIREEGNAFVGEFELEIPFGKYYVQEISANEQYIINKTKYPVEFSYQGQDEAVVEIAVNNGEAIENNLIERVIYITPPVIPETGDEKWLLICLSVMVISLVTTAWLRRRGRRL